MSPKKQFVFFLLAMAIGYGASQFFLSSTVKKEIEIEETRFDVSKAEQIKERIITKYFKEKNPAKRLEASDEIMEKVILLFMANLGIKLSEQDKNLVSKPISYDDYLQKVLTLCPSLPVNKGPEVFLNDGSDEARKKLEDQLRTCKETYSGLNRKPKLKTDEQKIKFVNFEDNIFKKYGRTPESLFPFDIYSELWSLNVYSEKLQGFPTSFVSPYLGELDGIFRTRSGEQGYIKIRLTEDEKSKNGSVLLNLSIVSQLGLRLGETYKAEHPQGHSNTGKGPCRGLVLSQGKSRAIHLVKVPGRKGYFGRIYYANEMVSSFFVMKDYSKKQLNPAKWGRDRGYW